MWGDLHWCVCKLLPRVTHSHRGVRVEYTFSECCCFMGIIIIIVVQFVFAVVELMMGELWHMLSLSKLCMAQWHVAHSVNLDKNSQIQSLSTYYIHSRIYVVGFPCTALYSWAESYNQRWWLQELTSFHCACLWLELGEESSLETRVLSGMCPIFRHCYIILNPSSRYNVAQVFICHKIIQVTDTLKCGI